MDLKEAARVAGVRGIDVVARFRIGKATASRWLNRDTPVPSRYVKEFAAMLKVSPENVLPPVIRRVVEAIGERE